MQPSKAGLIPALSFIVLASLLLPAHAIEVVEGQPAVVTGNTAASPSNHSGYGAGANVGTTRGQTGGATYNTAVPRNGSASTELYVQLQALQVEMSELRGLVEQQAYLIEQLSQRRMDDYLDLDRRLVELQQAQASGNKPRASTATAKANATRAVSNSSVPKAVEKVREPITSISQTPPGSASTANGSSGAGASRVTAGLPSPPGVAGVGEPDEARVVYHAAYQQVKDREFTKAKVSLAAFIKNYPSSTYVPNAHFWLGELYYLDSNLEMSRDAFLALVSDHSEHRKVAEAKFKLGKIYHQLGNHAEAKTILQSVVTDHPDSKAVNPAREYLKNSL